MRNYIIGRLIRSIISIFLVVTLAIILIYTMVPRNNVFQNDPMISKLAAKPDEKARYKYDAWEKLGYLDFHELREMCNNAGVDAEACMLTTTEEKVVDGETVTKVTLSKEAEQAKEYYEAEGWTVEKYQISGLYYAYRDRSVFSIVTKWFGNLVQIDNPWKVTDALNPDIERKIYLQADHNGVPALKCSGCENKYLIYFNSSFPFIHQNIISLNFGISYPSYSGNEIGSVISKSQGSPVQNQVKFETGYTSNSAANLHKCKYKATSTLDSMDAKKFNDNYANCESYLSDPSMVTTSMIFGLFALIISYGIGLPAGILMASKKDKLADKIGMVYINFMIAVPSLAFIYFAKTIGNKLGFPDKFPTFGAHDVRSYILPMFILGILSTAGLMIWIRRYMIDQSSSDYVKFARAKGLSQSEIFTKHVLRNAIIPIVNGIPSSIILTISGSVITETVFAIPGMGKMLPDSIKAYNNNMVVSLTFIFTSLSILSLLLGDILVTLVDPRISLTSKGGTR